MPKIRNNLLVNTLANPKETAQTAGEALGYILTEFFKLPVLLLLSGGSALKMLDSVDEDALGENLTVAVLDERFDSNHLVNNFAQLQETDFYMRALQRDASFIGTLPRKGDTKEILAGRFEAALKKWRRENPQGKIVITIGMGTDGHTAGILPFPENPGLFRQLFDNKDKWVTTYDAGNKNPFRERITATLALLRTADKAVAFIVGIEKKQMLENVLLKKTKLPQLPALVFWEIGDLQIYTDIKTTNIGG